MKLLITIENKAAVCYFSEQFVYISCCLAGEHYISQNWIIMLTFKKMSDSSKVEVRQQIWIVNNSSRNKNEQLYCKDHVVS